MQLPDISNLSAPSLSQPFSLSSRPEWRSRSPLLRRGRRFHLSDRARPEMCMTFIGDFWGELYPFIILFLPFAGNNPAEERNWNAKILAIINALRTQDEVRIRRIPIEWFKESQKGRKNGC